jgi:surface antigen
MNHKTSWYVAIGAVVLLIALGVALRGRVNLNPFHKVGEVLDQYNGVNVYFNGMTDQTHGRNQTADGYNLGLKYQCVEFVKRYYYEKLRHKMPDTSGNAIDFFDTGIPSGKYNARRDLFQYRNPTRTKPRADDIVVFSVTSSNPFGHIAIISRVRDKEIEIVQQNAGPFSATRETIPLRQEGDNWRIVHPRILGWLRKEAYIRTSAGQ